MSLKKRNALNVIRRGCNSTPALIEYSSLPVKYRAQWEAMHGEPGKQVVQEPFMRNLHADDAARKWYSDYLLEDGTPLPLKAQAQYRNEAAVLNALIETMNQRKMNVKSRGGKGAMWDEAVELIHRKEVEGEFPHSLPTNERTLRRKVKSYKAEGYASLVHSGFCNDNSRKVSMMIERLLLSLYTMQNKPFCADVYTLYNMFMQGKYQIYDKQSGELFDRKLFTVKGQPVELSESTVWAYLNKADNRPVVDAIRNDDLYNSRVHRPHHHRKPPKMSLSKISMDDRDLPRKMHDGNRVKAYYSYDVASGCVIGYSYSRKKDDALFVECLRNMLQMLRVNGLPMPAEVEVEHHIVNHFKEELDMMFPIVRWCRAGNSQEKHAEQLNKAKKYGTEKKNHTDIGRWWARSEAYLSKTKREGADYVSKTYDYDRLVAEDIADVKEYNNNPHPRQKQYPGMTRWEVLLTHLNMDLAQPNDAIVYKCIGNKTESTIRNNQYLKVQYAFYQIECLENLARLRTNNYGVEAYWLQNSEGVIPEVYIYQGDTYIGRGVRIEAYNTARVEWTPADEYSFAAQSGYVSHFDATVKQRKNALIKTGIMSTSSVEAAVEQAAQTPAKEPKTARTKKRDIDTIINLYNREQTIAEAKNSF